MLIGNRGLCKLKRLVDTGRASDENDALVRVLQHLYRHYGLGCPLKNWKQYIVTVFEKRRAAEYRRAEKQAVAERRQARKAGNYYREPDAKLAFVVRIRGINQVPPKVKKILRLLRLLQVHNGVFVRLNAASQKMLTLVDPWITYGYPNLKTVRELIYKRGHVKIAQDRIPITDNSVIEKGLGSAGIICTEDLIHEIYTVGPNFRRANRFLWPFKLSSPTGGFEKKTNHFIEGGDCGNRGNKINVLVRRML